MTALISRTGTTLGANKEVETRSTMSSSRRGL